MADTATLIEPTAETPPASPPAAPPAPTNDTPPASTPSTAPNPPPEQPGQEDAWWKPFAGEDVKLQENMGRFTDPKALYEAYDATRQALRDSGRVVIPGKDADEKTLNTWNRTVGIPESPDGYKIDFEKPDGFNEFSEADKANLGAITKQLHEAGGILAHPDVVNFIHGAYANLETEAAASRIAFAQDFQQKTQSALKQEWGGDYERNVQHAGNTISRYAPKDELAKLQQQGIDNPLAMRFEDGTRLGDHPLFVKMFASIGADFGDDPVWTEAARHGGDPGTTLEQEYKDIMALRSGGDWKGYEAKQGRLDEIKAALAKQGRALPRV